jgi:O-antigen/teichoic acid export membrane protein
MSLPSLRNNILSLGAVQVGNFLVPLLVLPYLARVLGSQSYGQVVWVQTVMLFGAIWVDFGFGWSATREISAHRQDTHRVIRLAANVWALQWGLLFVFAITVLALAWLWAQQGAWILYAAGLGLVLGQVLLPVWLFQGLEALRNMAIIQLVSKVLTLPLLYVWVQGPQDQVWTLLFFSASSVLAGVLALGWVLHQGLVLPVKPQFSGMWVELKEGSVLFSSRALISLYTTLVPLAVGWWAGPVQLAYFNVADRFRQAVQALLAPVSQALFPRMSWLFEHDPGAARSLLRKSAIGMGALSALAGVVLWAAAEMCMTTLGGNDFTQGATVLRWLACVPFVVAMSNLMGVQVMLPSGMNKPFTLILGMASVLSLVLLYPMINHAGAQGAAQLVLLVECVVTGAMALYLWRQWRVKGN